MQGFQRVNAELESLGARVAGVSADTWASLGVFAAQNDIQFSMLSDWPELQTIAAFGVGRDGNPTAQRVTFIFDATGTLRTVIDDSRDMNAHPTGALAAVKDLAAAS
jgi:peroxiredoxin